MRANPSSETCHSLEQLTQKGAGSPRGQAITEPQQAAPRTGEMQCLQPCSCIQESVCVFRASQHSAAPSQLLSLTALVTPQKLQHHDAAIATEERNCSLDRPGGHRPTVGKYLCFPTCLVQLGEPTQQMFTVKSPTLSHEEADSVTTLPKR